MSQPNTRSEGNPARSAARGNIASKSRDAAERVETSVAEGVERVRNQADDARERAAERLRRVATQLESAGEGLRADDALVAKLAESASRSVGRVAEYVSTTDGSGMIRDTEQLARRQPALFFGGAFLLGLAAGRFLKSSRPESSGAEPGRFNQPSRDGEQRYGADERYRGSESRASFSRTEEDRRTGGANQERYRQNYDAAFDRDAGTEQRVSSANTPRAGVGSPGSASGAGVTASERNTTDPTKGSDS